MDSNQTLRIDEFTARLASAAPTPGGGGAAALVGAQAAALAEMAARVTAKSPRYRAVAAEMAAQAEKAQALRQRMLELIAEDARVFAALMAVWKEPRESQGHDARMQEASAAAAEVPLELAERAAGAVALALDLRDKVTPTIRADAELAVIFGRAAIEGALYNVRINMDGCTAHSRKEEWERRVHALCRLAEMECAPR